MQEGFYHVIKRIHITPDDVLVNMGCQGYPARFMEQLNTVKVREPAKLQDAEFVRSIMNQRDYHVFFGAL